MSSKNEKGLRWTSEMVVTAAERYINKIRFSKIDSVSIKKHKNKNEVTKCESLAILKDFILHSKNALKVYQPVELLWNDLREYQDFPLNASFFKLPNPVNYLAAPKYQSDGDEVEYLHKLDIYAALYARLCEILEGKTENKFYIFIMMSYGNKIARQLENCFEYIASDVVKTIFETVDDAFQTHNTIQLAKRTGKMELKLTKFTSEELYKQFTDCFDEVHDEQLLKEFRTTLENTARKYPPKINRELYQLEYKVHVIVSDVLGTICNRFSACFQPYSKVKKVVKKQTPVIRVFVDNECDKFLFAKDVEYAVSVALRNKFKSNLEKGMIMVESTDDLKKGIIYSVSWEEYQTILKKHSLVNADIIIIETEIKRTTHAATPIVTPYGTHCKLAADALLEIVDNAIEIHTFYSIESKYVEKYDRYFTKLHEVFSQTKKQRYFIECSKLDELISSIYSEIVPHMKKRDESQCIGHLEMKEIDFINFIQKMQLSTIFPNIKDHISVAFRDKLRETKKEKLTPREAHKSYKHCLEIAFFAKFSKFSKFIHNQEACWLIRKFPCECRERKGISSDEIDKLRAQPMRLIEQQMMELEYLDFDIDNECDQYRLIAKSGRKFCTNYTALLFAIEKVVKQLQDPNPIMYACRYLMNSFANNTEFEVFYLSEAEIECLCKDVKKRFERMIAYEKANTTNDKSKTEVCFDKCSQLFSGFFEKEGDDYMGYFDDFKDQLKQEEDATENGLPEYIVTRIFSSCKQIHFSYMWLKKKLNSLESYMKYDESHMIVMRMMNSVRTDVLDGMHVFSAELKTAIRASVKKGGRWSEEIKDQLEDFFPELDDESANEVYQTTPLGQIENILPKFGVNKFNILIVPDINYMCARQTVPLKMGYCTTRIRSPNNTTCSHVIHAQYDVFQNVCCDLNWMERETCAHHVQCTHEYRKEVLEELKKIGKLSEDSYISVSKISDVILRLQEDPMYTSPKAKNVRPALIMLHKYYFDKKVPKREFMQMVGQLFDPCEMATTMPILANKFLKIMGYKQSVTEIQELDPWRIKFVFMKYWIDSFFNDQVKLKFDITKAWTMSLPFVELNSADDFNEWMKTMGDVPNKFVNFDNFDKCAAIYRHSNRNNEAEMDDLFCYHHWNSSSDEEKYKERELSDDDNILFSTFKRGFLNKPAEKKEEKPQKNAKRTIEEFANRIVLLLPKFYQHLPDNQYCDIAVLENAICDNVRDDLDVEDYACLAEVVHGEKSHFMAFEQKLKQYFYLSMVDGKRVFRKKFNEIQLEVRKVTVKKGTAEEKVAEVKVEIVKKEHVEKKEITKKKENVEKKETVQKKTEPCKKCKEMVGVKEEVTKELISTIKRIKTLEKNLEKIKASTAEKESEISVLKGQLTANKQASRIEIKKLKEDVAVKDKQVVSLQQQFKVEEKNLAVWKKETEEMYNVVNNELNESQNKCKLLEEEINLAKNNETSHAQQVSELMYQNEQLTIRNEALVNAISELRQNNKRSQTTLNEKDNLILALQERIQQIEMRIPQISMPSYGYGYQQPLRAQPMQMAPLTPVSPVTQMENNFAMNVPVSRCPEVEKKLKEFKKTLRCLEESMMLDQALAAYHKFTEMTSFTGELDAATQEIKTFKDRYSNFVSTLEGNIKRIESDIGITMIEIFQLPQLPIPFSLEFVRKYESIAKRKPKSWKEIESGDIVDKELDDPECLICACDLEYGQKTTKCDNCNRRYHSECVSEWLKKNSICPVCRNALPDPNDYPLLN